MPTTPRKLDGYTLVRERGRGGMGTVWEALQTSTGQRVAIKCLHPEKTRSERALTRFRREAEVLCKVQHPVIVPVLDAVLEGPSPYIVLPFVEGRSLWEVVSGLMAGDADAVRFCREALPEFACPEATPRAGDEAWTRAVLRLGRDVAEALAAAHAQGLVHRDLKPGNVMITSRGAARLLDFGLVRDDTSHAATLTLSDERLGTPLYMSPEQVTRREGVDHRSDLYSLGISLIEALTLASPLRTDDLSDLYRAIVEEDPLETARQRGGWPAGLIDVFSAAVRKDPSDRYQDAGAFARDLARVLSGRPPSPPLMTMGRRFVVGVTRHARSLAVACGLILAVWGGATFIGNGGEAPGRGDLERARVALENGEFEAAVGYFRALLDTRPGDEDAIDGLRRAAMELSRRARRHESDFRYERAAADFELLAMIDPEGEATSESLRLRGDGYRDLARAASLLLDPQVAVGDRAQALESLTADLGLPVAERDRLLLRLLDDGDLEPRFAAAVLSVATRLRVSAAEAYARTVLDASSGASSEGAVWAAALLAQLDDEVGRRQLASMAREATPIGERALEQASQVGHPDFASVLLSSLDDDDAVRVRLASEGLSKLPLRRIDAASRSRILDVVAARLSTSIDLASGASLIDAVGQLVTDPDGERLLLMVLTDKSRPPALRAAAARWLGRSRSDQAVAALLGVLSDPGGDEAVRGAAALVLKPRSTPAMRALLNVVKEDDDAAVRARALVALGRGRVRAAVGPALRVLADSQDLRARVGAILSLGLIRESDDAVVGRLTELLGPGRHPDERLSAAWALGELDDPAVLPALIEVLEQESARIAARDRAQEALVGASSGLSALLSQLSDVGTLLGRLPELVRFGVRGREPAEAIVLAIARRVRAAEAGGANREADRAVGALMDVARSARRPALRAAAVSALGRLPQHRDETSSILSAIVREEASREVRRALALALTRLGDREAGKAWLNAPMRDGEDALVRALVLIRLGRQAEAQPPFLAAMRLGVLDRARLDLEPELAIFARLASAFGL